MRKVVLHGQGEKYEGLGYSTISSWHGYFSIGSADSFKMWITVQSVWEVTPSASPTIGSSRIICVGINTGDVGCNGNANGSSPYHVTQRPALTY